MGEVARGGLYEVEAAAGGWVTERWAATSGGRRAAATGKAVETSGRETQVLRGFSCLFTKAGSRAEEWALSGRRIGRPFCGPRL